ncbi:hypothetical protein GVN24_30065, partial [Rhizobium sp. CRIBSB]|nr:hypothetical protein [Rhizobium sp. CRIBSB]
PYAAPVVRPFEPSAPASAETDRDAGTDRSAVTSPVARPPLEAPVAVDAYVGNYEVAQTDAQRAYERGVAEAENGMDRRMGPLDGLWRVRDTSGVLLFSLALTDPGGEVPLEGAWRDSRGRMGAAASTLRTDQMTVIVLDGEGELRLSAGRLSGVIVRGEQTTPVQLAH